MKPRKKQRIEGQAEPKKATSKRQKQQEAAQEDPEDSLEDEGLEEVIEEEDGDEHLDGITTCPHRITKADEMPIDDAGGSDEDEEDDFQDIKSKSTSHLQSF